MARKAAQIQSYANINDAKSFYEAPKVAYGPRCFSLYPVRSTDGVLINDKELILARWAKYLQNLLNKVHTPDPGFLDDPPTLPIISKLDDLPSFDEVVKTNTSLKDNKTAVLITSLLRSLSMVDVLYTEGCIISSLTAGPLNVSLSNGKNNNILAYKQKGDRAECGNSRGISLLSVAGKELAKIMLTRLLEHVVDLVLPESQCGYRRGRSTIYMIFVARQLQDKCCENIKTYTWPSLI